MEPHDGGEGRKRQRGGRDPYPVRTGRPKRRAEPRRAAAERGGGRRATAFAAKEEAEHEGKDAEITLISVWMANATTSEEVSGEPLSGGGEQEAVRRRPARQLGMADLAYRRQAEGETKAKAPATVARSRFQSDVVAAAWWR
jgi:hypothetical protein